MTQIIPNLCEMCGELKDDVRAYKVPDTDVKGRLCDNCKGKANLEREASGGPTLVLA